MTQKMGGISKCYMREYSLSRYILMLCMEIFKSDKSLAATYILTVLS